VESVTSVAKGTANHINPDDVATLLGLPLPASPRVVDCVQAAEAWVIKRRFRTDPDTLFQSPDVRQGTAMYAALLHTQRAQPQGFPGVTDLGVYSDDLGLAMSQIYRLVGGMDPAVA
jgi:hypothetical protein